MDNPSAVVAGSSMVGIDVERVEVAGILRESENILLGHLALELSREPDFQFIGTVGYGPKETRLLFSR